MLKGKNIILGVTGSIAAYKAAFFVRLLVKEGAAVKVIMTDASKDFITPLTLSTVSKNPVVSEFVKGPSGEWNNHVDLGLWGDAMIIAPASANTIGKMANGICDNILLATYLSARCPVFSAPAMDLDMYQHPSVTSNLEKLVSFGNHLIHTTHGELASGLVGQGRLAEPEQMLDTLCAFFEHGKRLDKKKILITAGPTYEAIDPVRFIGNHSTGKMGFAIALEAANQGAVITLVSGPTQVTISHPNIDLIKVNSGKEMYTACKNVYQESEITILAAAVADYAPKTMAAQKIKKYTDEMQLDLVKTIDIAKALGEIKTKNQINVGFALETNAEIDNAQKKIVKKNLDLIVLNSLKDEGAGFGHDTNKISIIDNQNNIDHFELKSKKEVAKDIINAIVAKINS